MNGNVRPNFVLHFPTSDRGCQLAFANFQLEDDMLLTALTVNPEDVRYSLFEALAAETRVKGILPQVFVEQRAERYEASVRFEIPDPKPELWLQVCVEAGAMECVNWKVAELVVAVDGYFDPGDLEPLLADYEKGTFPVMVITGVIDERFLLEAFHVRELGNQIPNLKPVGT